MAMTRIRSREGDVLDELCWRHYGREDGVGAVLAANPGLAAVAPVLPAGVVIVLPDLPPPAEPEGVVELWSAS